MEFTKKYRYIFGLIILIVAGSSYWYVQTFQLLPAPAFYLFNSIPNPSPTDRILVVSPHPDDESLGVSGFIARAHRLGATIEIVIATDGDKHHLKSVRHQETLSAMDDLGIDAKNVEFYDYPDGKLSQHQTEFNQSLLKTITAFQPTIIFSTHPADIHPDHRAVGEGVDQVIQQLTTKPRVLQFLIHYHRYPRPEGYSPASFMLPPAKLISTDTNWQKFTLSADEETLKEKAIREYRSQLSGRNPILRDLLLSFIRQNEMFVVVQ